MEKLNQSNNLNTFSILFLVKGVLTLFLSFIPLIYVFLGPVISASMDEADRAEMPFDLETFMVGFGLVFFVIIIVMAILNFVAARMLKKRTGYYFIFVMAILSCLSGVLGILLGVFTLIELNKPHVKELFGQS